MKKPLRVVPGERATTLEPVPLWREQLLRTSRGEPKPILANAMSALRMAPAWQGVLGFDEFALATQVLLPPPWEAGSADWASRAWTPRDDVLAANWLQHEGISVGIEIAQASVETVAADRKFHPVRAYLQSLIWDGVPRVNRWLSYHLGADPTPLNEVIGQAFLVSACARINRPGCKADHMLVLEGPQGLGKSSAIRVLADPWFSDDLPDMGSKDAAMSVRAAWILEVSELDAMSKAEVAKVKAFITRTADRFRPPYGRRVIEQPRQSVFIGSTNDDAYLRDETGGRRFWPVRVTSIDIEALRTDRDQLWAEAMHLYRAGAPTWIVDEERAAEAAEEQSKRYVGDPWEQKISAFLSGRETCSTSEVLADCLNIEIGRQGKPEQTRVGQVLKRLGWERFQFRRGDDRLWGYRRVTTSRLV